MNQPRLLLAALFFFAFSLRSSVAANAASPAAQAQAQAAAAAPSAPAPATTTQQAPPQKITHYTLPPDRYQKARNFGKIRFRFALISFVYGLLVLWLILSWKLSAKYRTWAESVSSKRFVQALIFSPLLVLTIDVLKLPTGIYQNYVSRQYGLSVQGWRSWFLDWTKGELVGIIIATILIYLLYAVIHKSPRRWWFYFWLVSLPIGLLLFFLQPLIIDPMFNKFEPLAQKDPELTASLEKFVQRAGQSIPRERMFWMGASVKTTAVDAYVTGFGASKRIVVLDTTIAKATTPQILFVAGHEMGHYVLGHIPKGLAFFAALFFVFFYLGYRTIGWVLTRWGPSGMCAASTTGPLCPRCSCFSASLCSSPIPSPALSAATTSIKPISMAWRSLTASYRIPAKQLLRALYSSARSTLATLSPAPSLCFCSTTTHRYRIASYLP